MSIFLKLIVLFQMIKANRDELSEWLVRNAHFGNLQHGNSKLFVVQDLPIKRQCTIHQTVEDTTQREYVHLYTVTRYSNPIQ